MNKTNLSPCPFCGGTARRSKGGTGENTYFGVGCDSTQQCPAYLYGLPHRTQEQADAAWNMRRVSIAEEPYAWFWSHGRENGVLTARQDFEQHQRDYPNMVFTPVFTATAQPKPVFVREGDLDLDKLNKDLIDYRDQIARLRARIAVLDPVFSDAEGYQL